MSGVVGHMMYAMLGARVAEHRRLPIVPVIKRHYASYLCGSYLGCDIQTLPAATCDQSGEPVGYGSQVPEQSPLTGGPVTPWKLQFEGSEYTPRDIHSMFYGRSHLTFGWNSQQREYALPWDQLPDYLAMVAGDALTLFGDGHRQLAYVLGWLTHIIGDSLIKSVQPGIDLDLLNGKYTPENRPIQDLVTFHEVGVKELGVSWKDLMADMAATPVYQVQLHYMRLGKPRGGLGKLVPDHWEPDQAALIRRVLMENRRYQRIRNGRIIEQLALTPSSEGLQCSDQLREKTGGLGYREMVEMADNARFRYALWQMGEAVGEIMEQVVQRQPLLEQLPQDPGPSWSALSRRWRR